MLRVLSLNIWNLEGGWRDRRVEIAAWLTRLDPHVVCLQEVMEAADGRNQARWLADSVDGYHVAYAGADIGEGRRFGNAVLSRWPVDGQGHELLAHEPRPDEVPRLVLHARTGGIDVFVTHLNWRHDDGYLREVQVRQVAAAVEALADPAARFPPVLAGDFNAEPDSTEIRFLCGLASLRDTSVYYQDAWRVAGGRGPGHTWDNRNPFALREHEPERRIDYVFVGFRRDDGTGTVETARVVCDRALTGTFASDHFGVLAEIAGDVPPQTPR